MKRPSPLHCLLLAAVLLIAAHAASQPQPALYIKAFGVKRIHDCSRQISALSSELETMHFPKGWTIAVACTQVAWNESLRLAEYPATESAFTSLSARITVVNGAIFRNLQSEYRHSIAHELAHILCNCSNEAHAESLASKLEREAPVLEGNSKSPADGISH